MTAPGAPPTERTRPNTADSTQATERNYLLLVSVTGSLIVLVFALLTWLDLSRLSDQEFQQRRMIAQVVADANDSMLTSALWDFNMVTLGSILDQMVTHPDVRYVSVRYPSGEIVAERGNGTDLISRVKITQSLSAELDGDPTEIGDLQVVLEDDEAYQQRITNVLVERLIWLLLILLITLMAIHISRRQLAGPLADLRESVAKLVQGQHDTKIPFQKVPGEIGATARVVHNLYTNTQNLYDLQERLVKGMTAKSQEVREVKHNVAELSRNNSLFLASVGQEIRAR